jgi:hypothetical protein
MRAGAQGVRIAPASSFAPNRIGDLMQVLPFAIAEQDDRPALLEVAAHQRLEIA